MKTVRVAPESTNSFYTAAKPLFIGTLFSLIVSFILLVCMAFYMSMNDIPAFASLVIVYIVIAIASLIGGIVSAKMYKCRGMMIGALCGIVYFLFVFIVGLLFSSHSAFNTVGLLKFVLSLVFGTFGGIFGVNMKR